MNQHMQDALATHLGSLIADEPEFLVARCQAISQHEGRLTAAGLIRGKRIKQWTFYKRDERQLKRMKKLILDKV